MLYKFDGYDGPDDFDDMDEDDREPDYFEDKWGGPEDEELEDWDERKEEDEEDYGFDENDYGPEDCDPYAPALPATHSLLHQRAEGQGLQGVASNHMRRLNSLLLLNFQRLMQKAA